MKHGAHRPEWFPKNPYYESVLKTTMQDFERIVPNANERTGIAWLVSNLAYEAALEDCWNAFTRLLASDET